MPRPGPRPYECVRRAWHSDKHQPMRGSLIQEIFRVVNEVHTSTTKKNKEWQEKLPVVVLKAEEIMYSKANSEAEYMDLKTLLDRANDAINTIIRRDESTETGELLQPCIEAALNLGCIPRIPSRSQRNTNPRCYLASGIPEPSKFSASVVNRTNEAAGHTASSQFMPNLSNFVKPTITNLIASVPESRDHLATVVVPLSNGNHLSSVENFSVCSVYPLYCAGCLEPQHASSLVPESVLAAPKTFKVVITQNGDPPARDLNDSHSKPHSTGCDLSLRLGTFVATRPSTFEEGAHHDVEYGSSRAGGMLNDRILKMDKQLSFITRVDEGDPLDPRVPGNRLDV